MSKTLVEKILSDKSQKEVYANDLVVANIDFANTKNNNVHKIETKCL